VFIELLERFSAEPAVVSALADLRAETPHPPGLEAYLLPDTDDETLAGLSWHIESLLAQDRVDDAIRLALDTAAVLDQFAPRAGELDPNLRDLPDLVEKARQDILDAIDPPTERDPC
jgi:hypothetical protein